MRREDSIVHGDNFIETFRQIKPGSRPAASDWNTKLAMQRAISGEPGGVSPRVFVWQGRTAANYPRAYATRLAEEWTPTLASSSCESVSVISIDGTQERLWRVSEGKYIAGFGLDSHGVLVFPGTVFERRVLSQLVDLFLVITED